MAYGVLNLSVSEFEQTPCAAFWHKAAYRVEYIRNLEAERVKALMVIASTMTDATPDVLYGLFSGRDWETGQALTETELEKLMPGSERRQTQGELMDQLMRD